MTRLPTSSPGGAVAELTGAAALLTTDARLANAPSVRRRVELI